MKPVNNPLYRGKKKEKKNHGFVPLFFFFTLSGVHRLCSKIWWMSYSSHSSVIQSFINQYDIINILPKIIPNLVFTFFKHWIIFIQLQWSLGKKAFQTDKNSYENEKLNKSLNEITNGPGHRMFCNKNILS